MFTFLRLVPIINLQAYIELLKRFLSDFSAVKFYKSAEFTFLQRSKAEEALFNALKDIESEETELSEIAGRLLDTFDEHIKSASVSVKIMVPANLRARCAKPLLNDWLIICCRLYL